MLALVLAAAVTATPSAAASATPDVERTTISRLVEQHHGSGTRVDHVFIHQNYAMSSGESHGKPVIDGLRLSSSGWHVVCTLRTASSPTQLMAVCGFPSNVAALMSADEAAQTAAERGQFGNAIIAQERAFASAKGPDRDLERARVQELTILNEQMRTGLLTRSQAIQRWGEFRYSWMLPY